MTVPLNGRDLLYNAYIQDKEKCRQAIQVFQREAENEKQARTSSEAYKAPTTVALARIRLLYVSELSRALFGDDTHIRAALMRYLQDKLKKKPSDLPLPECWAKLFDKFVDPAKVM
ncbi:MAG: hypothetical protein LLG04_11330 [Parachlamydia sp.]|nr:hypothetical protein [Parachlamydia sp.]